MALDIDKQLQNDLSAQFANQQNNNNKEQDFSIKLFKYPLDLGADDLQHYITFSINVRGKSKLNLSNERRIGEVKREDTAQLTEDQLSGAAKAGQTAIGAAAGYAGGKLVGNYFSKVADRKEKTGGGTGSAVAKTIAKAAPVGGAVLGGVAGLALSYSELLDKDTSSKISDVIALYVDGPPSVRYNAQYSNKDLGTLAGIVGGASSAVSTLASAETAAATALAFAKLPSAAGLGSPAELVGASAKVALNPFKEVLFESIDFRTFAFKYRFFPKSETESNEVNEIIKRFKFHMHPELSANKLFFIYPSEFEITYYFGGRPNNQQGGGVFHRFKPCVLESMDVTYGGEQFSSFIDGKPTEINMSLTFRETEILTKQQIKNGF